MWSSKNRLLIGFLMLELSFKMAAFQHPVLGELERAVMDHLWSHGPADVKSVQKAVGRPRKITLNTVQSTLKRLHEKGLLRRDKVSHAYIYTPTRARAEFQRDALGDVLEQLMEGEPSAMLTAFVDVAERAGPDRLAELEELISQRLEGKEDS